VTAAVAAATCEVCGTPKKPRVGGSSLAQSLAQVGEACELCYSEVLAEVEKRKARAKEEQGAGPGAPGYNTGFDTFLEQTAAALFKAYPKLKPKVGLLSY
jgi:hypothetical protein